MYYRRPQRPTLYEISFVEDASNLVGLAIERERSLEMIRESELRYRRLFESATDGILILDADTGRIVDANPFLTRLLGDAYADLIGQDFWQIAVLQPIANSIESFRELTRRGYVREDNLPLETNDGNQIFVEFVSHAYSVGDTNLIQCNLRDVSERQRAAEALRQSEERFRLLVDQAADAFIVHDFEGKILEVNQRACQSLGYSKEQLLTMFVTDIESGVSLARNLLSA